MLPSGTVTFLFTDIEGSTKLAQAYPDQWELIRENHHAVLRGAIESHNGYVFQIIGDAFCAAFHIVKDGLITAIEAQRALQTSEVSLRVRMGLHTGLAELRGNDYHGCLTLVMVQRVMSVAYGGQTLLSNASAELIHNELPDGITLRDMKEHRLKGLLNPERLWQAVAPGLRQDFPPLQSLKEIPNNLPAQLSTFIGREKEVSQVKQRLEKNRLVTLTGSGGIGKTRLSIQVASQLLSEYPNGAWLVELAPLTDPALVTQAVCSALDVTTQSNTSPLTVLTDYLRAKKLLLVVDNCEHLIDACAQLCESLLHACPNIRIIASSREALGIDGENAYRVPSLSLPDSKSGLHAIEESEAVKLFMERATAILPEFELTESNASFVAQICQRLDGIALAIELAASRVKILKVEQIASRLDDAFRLLTGGSRTALPRQQTLRALIDWSYNLLSEEERTVLRRLSVFLGGWTLGAAEAVCMPLSHRGRGRPAGSGEGDMLDLLTHLVDKSLVSVDREHGDEPRYYLLETIRQYAREKLSESGEAGSIRDQHLAYFFSLAQQAEPEVQGANQLEWLDRLEVELDNLRTALEWSLESGDKGTETGLRLASSLWWFWFIRNYHQESRWLRQALVASQVPSNLAWRANALSRLAWVSFFDEASADEGFALGQTLGPAGRESVALALLGKGAWANYQADDARAISLFEESLKTFREIGNRWGICEASTWLGMVLINIGAHQQAMTPLEESLALARQARDGNEIAFALWILGNAVKARGDYSQAITLMEESLTLLKELKVSSGVAFVLIDLGKAVLGQGNYEKMISYYKEILNIYWNWGVERYIADGIELLARAFVINQQPERAARLLGAAEALRQSSGAELFPYQAGDYERNLQALHSQLDEVAFKACWIECKAMNAKQAVEYALEEVYE